MSKMEDDVSEKESYVSEREYNESDGEAIMSKMEDDVSDKENYASDGKYDDSDGEIALKDAENDVSESGVDEAIEKIKTKDSVSTITNFNACGKL